MEVSATQIARALLQSSNGGLEEWRVHDFSDDMEAHDVELTERVRAEFIADLDRVQAELSREFGPPARKGTQDDEVIPLNGVFRFTVWELPERILFAAAAHEDRGLPMLLMIGSDATGNV